jgi:rhodanese-related sulfurtransferase
MKVTCAVDKIRKLKPSAVKDILNKDKKGQFLLLDVRQSCEYESGHIPKALLIPLNELEARQKEIDRDKIIITYSRSGHMSVAAAVVLYQMGFRSLFHLDGGISDWSYGIVTGLPEVEVKSTDDKLQFNKIYMEAMAVEMGFKSPHHFRSNKTLGRARKAIINLFIKRPKLLTTKSDLRNILVLSVKLEKAHGDFLMMAGSKAKSSQVKETFQQLFDAKAEHMQRLYNCIMGLTGEESLEDLEQESGIVNVENTVEVNPFIARTYDEFANEVELLETAVEKEYVYHDFFEQW